LIEEMIATALKIERDELTGADLKLSRKRIRGLVSSAIQQDRRAA
jgi:hypothetical protein